MSPILHRDVGEHVRQAKRLAAAVTGQTPPDEHESWPPTDSEADRLRNSAYATASTSRLKEEDEDDPGPLRPSWEGRTYSQPETDPSSSYKGKQRALALVTEDEQQGLMLDAEEDRDDTALRNRSTRRSLAEWARDELLNMSPSRWVDLRNLLLEASPALLLNLIGMIFTGELLEHLARWTVFLRVDELFILVPMVGNLKGNLEMCLSARLGTSANIGELDSRSSRRTLLKANLSLLGLQALLISSLAGVVSFVLGLMTRHRLGDIDGSGDAIDPGLETQDQEWHEGYTRPGWAQLVMVLATGMGSAGLSSAILGSFMSSMIVVARWWGIDPDNITAPVATCLGDLLTLFILALLGSALVGAMDTPIPLIAVVVMSMAAVWFTRAVMRDEWVKNIARGSWAPLTGAMLISSGTGMALDAGVGRYRGFALIAIAMTGLTGSLGAIHANRLSTLLHTSLSSKKHHHHHHVHHPPPKGLTGPQGMLTLFLMSFPTMGCFYAFVTWAGWIDVSLGIWGWIGYALAVILSLTLAHNMTLFFWSRDLDPDSYTLPIHSALVDFMGQLLLMAVYELCNALGRDVMVKETV